MLLFLDFKKHKTSLTPFYASITPLHSIYYNLSTTLSRECPVNFLILCMIKNKFDLNINQHNFSLFRKPLKLTIFFINEIMFNAPLSFLSPLTVIEKITVITILILLLILTIDRFKSIIRNRHNRKMLQSYLYLKKNKWEDLVGMLTHDSSLTHQDIDSKLEFDLSQFDAKYKDILYQELVRIKQHKEVNPANWEILKLKLLTSYSSN